jgi:hypothetical protein
MKKINLLFFFMSCFLFAQNKELLYGFNAIPQNLLLNPGAEIENDWYFGIPLLSHIHTNVGMTGISAFDVFANDGRDFNAKLREAVYKLDNKDFFTINQQLELFSGGFTFGKSYERDQYLSFGMYQETDVFMYFPKDYAVLLYEGNHNNLNRIFNLGDITIKAEVVSALHVGYTKTVNKQFTFGVRGKLYSSVINVNSVANRGTFITVEGDNNYFNHIIDLDLEIHTSGLASLSNDENPETDTVIKDLRKRLLFGGNLGLGFDMGFTYKPTKQFTIEGSLQDIGFIRHKKDVESYKLEGIYEYDGVNPVFPESGSGQTAEEYWAAISQDFKDLFETETTQTKYTTWRPIKFNAAFKYAFGQGASSNCNCLNLKTPFQNEIGLQLFAQNRPKHAQFALTAFYYKRLLQGLDAKATYTIDSYSNKNLGLGISTQIGKINFYILANNLIEYQNLAKTQSVSLQLGFNYIFKTNEN